VIGAGRIRRPLRKLLSTLAPSSLRFSAEC